MYTEDQLLPLSTISQLLYCERRAALILIEQAWDDNRYTIEGQLLHQRVHTQQGESRGNIQIVRGLALRSFTLGLSGKADVVEFHHTPPNHPPTPFPIEYKRGRPKPDRPELIQLCAQAICLEEMLNTKVPQGAIFYGTPHRRLNVTFTPQLRTQTHQAAQRLHQLFRSRTTPKPNPTPKCKKCSLRHLCLPNIARKQPVARYLQRALQHTGEPNP